MRATRCAWASRPRCSRCATTTSCTCSRRSRPTSCAAKCEEAAARLPEAGDHHPGSLSTRWTSRRPRRSRRFAPRSRAWLEARAKRRQPGTDPEHFYSSSDTSKEADAAHVRACKAWQQTLYDAGWAGIAWPKEFGGRGGAGLAAAHLQRGAVALRRRGRRVRGRDRDGRPDDHRVGDRRAAASGFSRRC